MPTWDKCLPIVEELYNSGVPVREIARHCGNSTSMVYRVLYKLVASGRVRLRRGPYDRKKRVSAREAEEIVRLRLEGRSINEIARLLGRPRSTVHYVLKREGLAGAEFS